MLGLLLFSLILLWKRMAAVNIFFFGSVISLLVVTPRPLGDPFFFNDYAMFYNRLGEAVLMLLAIVVFLPRKSLALALLDSAACGLLLVLLLFTKANYLTVGLVFWLAAVISRLEKSKHALAVVCAFAALLALFLWTTGMHLSAVLEDFRIMKDAQNMDFKSHMLLVNTGKQLLSFPLLLFAALLLAHQERGAAAPCTGRVFWRSLGVVSLICGGALLLLSSNCQRGEMPLLSVAALFCFENFAAAGGKDSARRASLVSMFAVMLAYLIPTMKEDLRAQLHYFTQADERHSDQRLAGTQLADFYLASGGPSGAAQQDYKENMIAGLKLVRSHVEAQTALQPLLFSNPFAFALGIAPAEGGAISAAYESMNARSHPVFERFMRQADYVLSSADSLTSIFGAELAGFEVESIDKASGYELLRIKSAAP
jgi:hypothetical protein